MRFTRWLPAVVCGGIIFAACLDQTGPSLPPSPTAAISLSAAPPTATAAFDIIHTASPAPTPTTAPRTLTICTGDEPDTLYPYGGQMFTAVSILEAIYDGPVDQVGYRSQPVILEKIPSLADGDAFIQPAVVGPGDLLIDADGELSTLHEGVMYRPAGCRGPECEQVYTGAEPVILDQMVVTFTWKTGITWSDGVPLTAQDSVYSFQLDDDPATPTSKFLTIRTASYLTSGPETTVWTGMPGFLSPSYFLNFWQPLPEHIWSDFTAAELVDAEIATRTPLGWGPYILEDWVFGSHIRLVRNPHYFRAAEGLPHFDMLIFRFVGQDSARNIASLLDGSCDMVNATAMLSDVLPELVELDTAGALNLHTAPTAAFEHLLFGLKPLGYDDGYQPGVDRPDFFGDLHTRQAFTLCLDRQALVDELFSGRSQIMPSYVPLGHPLLNPAVPQYDHDAAAGMALLTAAGWIDHDSDPSTPRVAAGVQRVPDGTPLSVQYWTTDAAQRVQAAEIMRASLADCGIEILPLHWEAEEFFWAYPEGPLYARQFDLAGFAWLTGVIPPCQYWLSEAIPGEANPAGPNFSGFSSPEFDAACRETLSLLPGEEGFFEAHALAQEIFARDLPAIPLYQRIWVAATRPDFSGLAIDPWEITEMWNIEAFDYGGE